MEEISIQYLPEVEDYLNDLAFVLFSKNYFGFLEDAREYVDGIIDFIDARLHTFPPRHTPANLLKLGSAYIFYKVNHGTAWYIFFEKSAHRYLVTYITNSHSELAKYLGDS